MRIVSVPCNATDCTARCNPDETRAALTRRPESSLNCTIRVWRRFASAQLR